MSTNPSVAGILPVRLADTGLVIRLVRHSDAAMLAAAQRRNRDHLAPWEPLRPDIYYEAAMQAANLTRLRLCFDDGTHVPFVIVSTDAVVGAVTVSDIVRGAFQSGHLGYWLDKEVVGQGVMTAAIGHTVDVCRDILGLHRLQAATLPENTRSKNTLRRAGFEPIGRAREYLSIGGHWRDHDLFHRIL